MPITRSLPLCRRTFVTDLAFNLIMDCGQAMLANGGEVFRAQDTMEIMARSFGIVDFHVYVLTNGIFASAQNGTVSAVRHVPVVSTNLGHVEAINAISRRVADGELDLNSAQLEFERMKRMPTLSPLYNCAAGTMGAGCFAMLFGGGLPEMLVGALGGLLASASSCALSKHHISRIFRDMLSAIAGTLTALIAQLVYPALQVNFAIIGALMILVPGLLITNSMRDIIYGDTNSGMFRIVQVVLMAMAIALGTAAAWRLTAGIYGQTVSSTVSWPALAQAAAVFIGCSGFCILFNVHGHGMLLADIGGMLSWMVYLLCTALGCDVYAANLFAAVFAALYSETMARVRKCPAVNYLVISTLPMLPGAGVYYTMSLGLEGRMMDSVAKGLETVGVAGSLAVGILLVSTVFRLFSHRGKK